MKLISGILVAIILVVVSADEGFLDFGGSTTPEKCAKGFPVEKIIPLTQLFMDILTSYRYDPEVKLALDHIVSEGFLVKLAKLENRDEFQAFKEFLQIRNWSFSEAIDLFKVLLHTLAIQAENIAFQDVNLEEITGGIHGLLMRIFERISLKEFRGLIHQWMECDPNFKETVNTLNSSEFEYLLGRLLDTPEYKDIVLDLEEYKVYLNIYVSIFMTCFDVAP